ncbi:transposase [Streptomyces sp. NBC_00151]|uniref:transposase n=1 Tax=Streptomyces sp. NBC_00151 TaxID=2975669 RepID=UPI003FA3D9CE
MASAPPGSSGRTRCARRAGLGLDDRRCRADPGQKGTSTLTGLNPVDRGKEGSKLHVLSEAEGTPSAVAVSGAGTHDSLTLKPLIRGIPAVRSRRVPRRRPVKLRADTAYFSAEHLTWLRQRGLAPRTAGPGIGSASGSAGTAGRSSSRSPGSSATAGPPSGTSDRAPTSSPSSASQPSSPAIRSSRNSPRKKSSKHATMSAGLIPPHSNS